VDVLCAPVRGEPFPQSDAENARFVEMRELGELDVAPTAIGVIEHAVIRRREAPEG